MPKKVPKGPFYFFMQEWKTKQNRSFPGGLREVSDACGPDWKKLAPQQKLKYEKMSKDHKEQLKIHGERYTSHNVPLTYLANESREKERQQVEMKRHIKNIIQDAVANNNLDTQEFYFIHFNYFCKTLNDYIPAEVAILKFNLVNGRCSHYHTLIDPGKLPLGMPGEAKVHSDQIHQIPPPPHARGERDYVKILENIVQLFFDVDAKEMPPLFTAEHEIPIAQSIFEQLRLESGVPDEFKIYPISELFFELKQITALIGGTEQPFYNIHVAKTVFEKDCYDYYSGMGCDFHTNEAQSKYKNCALTKVVGWGYTFADHCTKDLGIDLVPGRHVPEQADTTISESTYCDMSDTKSFISAQTRFDDSESDITNFTTPLYKTAPSTASRSTVRSHQPQQQRQQAQGAPPGFSNSRDPRNPWSKGGDSDKNVHNSTNPFVTEINNKRNQNPNATYAGNSGDYPALDESNPFSRSHMANEVRAPLGGAGRGILTPQRGVWG